MVSTDGQVPEQAYVTFLVQQMHASLDFLVGQHQVSRPDANLIKSKLPALSTPTTSVANEFTQLSMTPTSEASRNVGAPDTTSQSTIFAPPAAAPAQVQQPPQPQPSQQQVTQSPGRVVPPPPARPAPPQVRAKALWAYNGSASDDLTFVKGDIIIILAEENADWWRGEVAGREGLPGLFPSNHVERLPAEPVSPTLEHNTPQAYSQAHQPHYAAPPPPQTWQQQPYGHPPTGYYGQEQKTAYQQPPPQEPQTVVVEAKKKPFSGRLGQAFVGGVGFGAGSAVASNVVNSIL